MKTLGIVTFILMLLIAAKGNSQDALIPLWPKDKIPNSIGANEQEVRKTEDILIVSNVQEPTIEVYLPSKQNATGEAMLIFPGGGYGILAYDWEGSDIAKFLNGKGIAGIVVKYRLPSDTSQKQKHYVPLIDAQRALRIVRGMAKEFGIRSDRIGIIGFSAGGHLAASLGIHYDAPLYKEQDAYDTLSAKPNFMALGYPVITFGEPSTHLGSQMNLIGDKPNKDLVAFFSMEKQVTENTPSTFLFHATDDAAVPVENSLLFYKALKSKGVSATMHIYPKGGHGFSLATKDAYLGGWPERMFEWIHSLR